MDIFYFISSIVTAITSIALGYFVYQKAPKKATNKAWFLMSISVGLWSFGFGVMAGGMFSKAISLFFEKISHLGATFIPVFYLYFIISLINRIEEYKKLLKASYAVGFFLLYFIFSSWIIADVVPKISFKYYPKPGIFYPLFTLHFFVFVITAMYLAIKNFKFLSAGVKNQIKYVFVASVLGFLGGSTTFPLVFDLNFPPVGGPLVFVYTIVISYAIMRYRLMDIKVAITRTGTFVAVYTLVLGLPFAVAVWLKDWLVKALGTGWWMMPLGLMGLLATLGPFIYIYIEQRAEDTLLKEQKRYQETLKQASVGMTRIRNLKKLLDLIAHIVTKTVRISYAGIYLYNQQTNTYVLQIARDKGRTPIPQLDVDNPLITWITAKREPLIYEEVKRHMQDEPDATYKDLEKNMRLLMASVVIPSFLEDKILGFIVLGDKVSGQIYTPEDLNVFEVLASQAALAIENAQFYEEAKEMQEQIAQAEKMATVGTMADGLSHQINNRFYALSLIAGDTIDTIKLTDTSKCTQEIRDMIGEINHALERIQTNVMQGGEVVKGILKYTRKGEEGFEALTLNQILDGTLEMLQYKVKLTEIDIVRDFSALIPRIKGNLVQLQEAFFNFIDNAYDSTVERKTELKEPGYRGRITVSAHPKNNKLEIVIEDNGMGIRDDNLKKVFTPFFTTKSSSRKGTGLGLYVIRRIITDIHKGKIAFESAYKVGTRFILELPTAT
ncbi:MAG: GAF domain-containing protein [Candidatus Omnitrophica bacterium]|nr:GAF domain-containing protein [Candidatus Omnitrophota bacterium]